MLFIFWIRKLRELGRQVQSHVVRPNSELDDRDVVSGKQTNTLDQVCNRVKLIDVEREDCCWLPKCYQSTAIAARAA